MTSDSDVDAALIEVFEGRLRALDRLVGLGAEAFDRVFALYRTSNAELPPRLAALIAELRRESIDRWAFAIAAVARANPGRYLDHLGDSEPTTLDLVILAEVDDPRVTGILRRARRHGDWLVRHHATEALRTRGSPYTPDT